MSTPPIDALGHPAHILIVDDDDRIRTLLRRYLADGGARVSAADGAESARKLMGAFAFDLFILDVMMPQEDGFSLLESLRKSSQAPVILLTARGQPEDRIKGLKLGADDYLPKPFEPAELALRVNAVLRRHASQRTAAVDVARFGPFTFSLPRNELTRDGAPVRLTDAELALLRVLATRAGEPFTREDLARRTEVGLERSIDVQVTRLRRKIEADPRAPIYLQTVRGVGYRLAVD